MRCMRAVIRSLALAAILAFAAPSVAAAQMERGMPAPVTAPAMVVPAPVDHVYVSPTHVAPAPVSSTPPCTPASAPVPPDTVPSLAPPAPVKPTAVAQSGGTAAAPPRPVPLQAMIEKLGQGDRAFLAGDYRAALFFYQDAVYMAPQNAAARVKLGRAYLALRYPTQAIAQAEQALAAEPDNEEARRLLQDVRNPPPRPVPTAARPGTAEIAPAAQPRMYRFTPEPETAAVPEEGLATSAAAPREGPAADAEPAAHEPSRDGAVERVPGGADEPSTFLARADAITARQGDPGATAAAPTPGQRYRAALELLSRQQFLEAARELSDAIAANPRLAVAYAARGNAHFGLGRFREASDDYRAALAIDAKLATPLYGLAECFRVLGDSAASAKMYQRYADSRASDVREDLRAIAAKRAQELR
jgi:tetratricopeptide (TPR) repeat protein